MSRRDKGSLPTGFDPAAHPILCQHWFGVPLHPIGPITANLSIIPAAAVFDRRLGHDVGVPTDA